MVHGIIVPFCQVGADFVILPLALHELDPVFRKATLDNERLRALARDLHFHEDPHGKHLFEGDNVCCLTLDIVLQSMVICKQREVGGEGKESALVISADHGVNYSGI